MAFFKFIKSKRESGAALGSPDSADTLRRRAKHRLIGATVLVLAGVIGFPMVFDSQPRPIAVDIPIDIPDKATVLPLSIPAPAPSGAASTRASGVVSPSTASNPGLPASSTVPVTTLAQRTEEEVIVVPAKPAPPASKNVAVATPKALEKSAATDKPTVVTKPDNAAAEAAKAQALLDGHTPDKTPTAEQGRFIVQVGAFADVTKAREVRQKLERAGLKTYTHVAQTKDGSRIRVRVGPFTVRSEADKAADKIKKLTLPAAVLTL